MKRKVTDLGENEVISCPTEAEAIAICQLMHDAGLTWCDNSTYIEDVNWDAWKESSCYRAKMGQVRDFDFYKRKQFTILPASDFLPQSFYQPDPEEEIMSDRKRESFRFYDQLPEPLRTQAKENFEKIARASIEMADALINELNQIEP